MTFDWKMILLNALAGFGTAVAVDRDAYKNRTDKDAPFDWAIAVKRWLKGAGIGVAAGLGFGGL